MVCKCNCCLTFFLFLKLFFINSVTVFCLNKQKLDNSVKCSKCILFHYYPIHIFQRLEKKISDVILLDKGLERTVLEIVLEMGDPSYLISITWWQPNFCICSACNPLSCSKEVLTGYTFWVLGYSLECELLSIFIW